MKKLLYFTIICTLLVGCEPNNNPDKPSNNSNFSSRSFSVGDGVKVVFSPGNLQYHPKNHLWRFAEKQIDYIGDANLNLSSSYDGWVDMFGWGTGANPTHESLRDFVDWGKNKIGNDDAGTWYTLSKPEWEYLMKSRNNAPFLYGIAQVDGVNGLILLPDDWKFPNDIVFKSGFYSDFAEYQTFTLVQWSMLESDGAIFLPAAGYIKYWYDEYPYRNEHWMGLYWTSRYDRDDGPISFGFGNNGVDFWASLDKASVRLVKRVN